MNTNLNYRELYEIEQKRVKNKDDQITFLWTLLDDISTAGDMYKPEINSYFKYVNKKCEDRSDVANSIDGLTLQIVEMTWRKYKKKIQKIVGKNNCKFMKKDGKYNLQPR